MDAQSADNAPPVDSQTAAGEPITRPLVLVIDADAARRDTRRQALESDGFGVVVAGTAAEAAEAFATRPAAVCVDQTVVEHDRQAALRQPPGASRAVWLMACERATPSALELARQAGIDDVLPRAADDALLCHRLRQLLAVRRAGDSLRATEARLAAVQRIARLGVWEWDFARAALHWSAELETLLGVPAPAAPAAGHLALLDYVLPADREQARAVIATALAERRCCSVEINMCPRASEPLVVQFEVDVSVDEHGEPDKLIGALQDISDRRQADLSIRKLAYYDTVTGLPNRLLLYDRLHQAMLHAERYKRSVAVLFLDLDHFKRINDTLGHDAGDQLLRTVSERLSKCVRDSDSVARLQQQGLEAQKPGWDGSNTVARLGGDEFVVLLTEVRLPEDAAVVARRINVELSRPFNLDGTDVVVPTSIGISSYPEDGTDADTLIRYADAAMYHAKSSGRNRYQFYTPALNERMRERQALEEELLVALEQDDFLFHYQPRARLSDGAVVAVEALLRWQHPQHGLIGPDRFITIAEETGLIVKLGEWALTAACRQAALWQRQGRSLRVSVNLSALQFNHKSLPATVARALNDAGLRPDFLEFDLTESALLTNPTEAASQLRQLHDLGVQLSVDNFGSGYSSLRFLQRLPVNSLKIDRSFLMAMDGDGDGGVDVDVDVDGNGAGVEGRGRGESDLVRAIVGLGHSLGLTVTAQGVETGTQLDKLREYGCEEYQGFLLSKPLALEELEPFLQNRRSSAA